MTIRSYNQYCGLAYALDIVGERWTLLIIRELIAGPRRFKDLLDGLPGISTNLLAERLKSLADQGILLQRTLPPPAGSTVYELTPLGRSLEPMLLELGKWGSQFVPPSCEDATLLRLGSYALTFKTFFRPQVAQGVDETYELHVGNEVLQVQVKDGELAVQQGQALKPDVVIYTDMPTFMLLMPGQLEPQTAISQGRVCIEGDPTALDRLLQMCGLPGGHAPA
jgi:DNA-binding HxlR family transcriptional regulator